MTFTNEGALASEIQKRIEEFDNTNNFRKKCCELLEYLSTEDFLKWYFEIFFSTLEINSKISRNKLYYLRANLSHLDDYVADKTADLINVLVKKDWQVEIEELEEFKSLRSLLSKMSKDKIWPIVTNLKKETKIEYFSTKDYIDEKGYWWDL